MSEPSAMVIAVHRGGCEAYADGRIWDLRLVGRHAQQAVELAVGDDVSFDPDTRVVLEVAERRTRLARLRPRDDPRREHVIAANMDRLAVIASVRELRRTGTGRHTTTRTTLYRLRGGALVVDTPGVREIATGPLPEEIVDDAFPDIAGLAVDCRFRNCRHAREPDCAVRGAAERGVLPSARLRSYLRLRAEARAAG
jgi:putative ribosome biogenesis GTPase RsgA